MKLGIYLVCPTILAATVALSELEPRMILLNYVVRRWSYDQHGWAQSYFAALLTPDEEIELYIRWENQAGYTRLPATAFGPERELLANATRDGIIHPQPISTHQMIGDTAHLTETLVGIKMLVGRRMLFLANCMMLHLGQANYSNGWDDPERYLVISHWIIVHPVQHRLIDSQILLLDRKTDEIFAIARNSYDGCSYYGRRDGKIQAYMLGPDGLDFFASIRLEIARGTIIPRPVGQHSIGVYDKERGTVEVYNTDSFRIYRSAGHAGIDANVGPIAVFKQRKECLETFYGFVDPDVDELVAHIYRDGYIPLSVAFIRNRVTGKVRLLQKTNPGIIRWLSGRLLQKTNRFVRGLFSRFIELPEWAQVDTILDILIPSHSVNEMIENGGLAPIPFEDSHSHPVIEILTGNLPGYLEHSINRPNAVYYPDATFNPIIHFIFHAAA